MDRGERGWAARAMQWLGYLTAFVEVSIGWLLGTLAGGVLLGWLPASVAAGQSIHTLISDDPTTRPLGDVLRGWKRSWVRANAVGWPATLGSVILVLNWWIMSLGEGFLFTLVRAAMVVMGVWWALSIGYLVTLLGTPRTRALPAATLWRDAVLLPVGSPGTSLAWIVTIASILVIGWVLPVLAVLAGPAAVWFVTFWLNRRRFAEIDQARRDDSRTTTSNGA